MRIAIGSDHGGFSLKEEISKFVQELGYEVLDFGTDSSDSVDYPDFVELVGKAIQTGQADRGILFCGSGIGVCITANKMKGLYAAICHDTYSANQGVEHDDMNVLCLGGRVIGPDLAKVLVKEYLESRFIGNDPGESRHLKRVAKMKKIEEKGIN